MSKISETTHDVVGYEEHARVKLELERVSAVLADLIEEQMGVAVPVREVVAWVKHPESVHHLLASSGIQGIGTDDDTCCAGCGVDVDRPHGWSCTVFDARWRLGMAAGLRDFEVAREAAQAEDRARSLPLTHRPSAQINVVSSPNVPHGTAYLMPARTIEGRMAQVQEIMGLSEIMPDEVARFIAERATTPVEPQGPEFRREYLGEWPGALTPNGTRQESDARGMEVEEAEARHLNVVFQLPF